jgi:hypothetical protein
MDGVLTATGACNGCHAYPPTPGDDKPEIEIEGKGAHMVHVEHLSQLLFSQTWTSLGNPDTDLYDSATPQAICGVCHTKVIGNHMVGDRLINFGESTTYQFGPSIPFYEGAVGTGSASDPKTCSNISCHFTETPWFEPPQ